MWERTNRLAGYVMVIAGFIVAIAGLTGIPFATHVMAAVIGVAAVGLVVYSYVEWRREGGASRTSSP